MKTVIVPFCGFLIVDVDVITDAEAMERVVDLEDLLSVRIGSEDADVKLGSFRTFRKLIEDGKSPLRYSEAKVLEGA